MNTRLKLTLLTLTTHKNQGFSIVFALMIGVGMILTTSTMIIRASQGKNQTTAQESINKASSNTDLAVTRIAYFLNQNRELIKKPTDQWQTVANETTTTSHSSGSTTIQGIACDSTAGTGGAEGSTDSAGNKTTILNNLVTQSWLSIDENNPSAGDYRLQQYQLNSLHKPTKVKMQVEARTLQENSTDLSLNNSISSIEVTFPIIDPSQKVTAPMPGLWISDTTGGTGGVNHNSKQSSGANQPINAITWLDCTQMTDWQTNVSYVNNEKLNLNPITIGNRIVNPTEIQQVQDDLPDVPSSPLGAYNLGSLNASNCYITLPRTPGNTWGGDAGSECETINDRTSDTAIDGVYYYEFTGDVSLSNSQIRINPPTGTKVVIHVTGGITLSGKAMAHGASSSCLGASDAVATYMGDPDDPSKLELYSHSSFEPIDISETTLISGFVHAPDTQLKISEGQVRGAAWVKSMDASNSGGGLGCDRSIKQMDVGTPQIMEDPAKEPHPYLGKPIHYRTLETH